MIAAIQSRLQLFFAYWYDFKRYSAHSFVYNQRSRPNRRAMIRILTHYLEGGMCFPDVRLGYAQDKVNSLIEKIRYYAGDFGPDETVQWAMQTIRTYIDYHEKTDIDLTAIRQKYDALARDLDLPYGAASGGYEVVSAETIRKSAEFDFSGFLKNRHSVRQYTGKIIDEDTIRAIVGDARECPNVCNRQTCRVYALTDPADVQKALQFQAGNAGFRQEIRTLFIVTSDMGEMNLVGERFQGWIDGGIFAMTLALSIHARGLGACFLNWSVEPETDIAMRHCLGIPDNELVITMMSAGHLKPEFNVPVSHRKPVDDILTLNPRLN